ncbi:BREX system ATP-binding domain-containing protein [Micromonospora carbonacea]|uniref:BREX system ATP-binding domain-containing protein n=1 Tax=Micromonospora carbonacea TaxID=47853 RepID=UPI003D98602F
MRRLAPLAQRLATDFPADPQIDDPRAVQLRLPGFTVGSLVGLGRRVRDLFAAGPRRGPVAGRGRRPLPDGPAGTVTGRVGIAPRLSLRKLVAGMLDPNKLYPDFDPRRDYALTLISAELTDVERNAARAEDIELKLP